MASKEQQPRKPLVYIDVFSSPEKSDNDSTPLRPIFCLKNRNKMREFDQKEECFILGFDPDDDDDVHDDNDDSLCEKSKKLDFDVYLAADISVVAEKGKVACRDFPHPRYVCVKHPFEKTPHESYCELCYCYVCDVPAPCKKWATSSSHCHAIDNESWRLQRRVERKIASQH